MDVGRCDIFNARLRVGMYEMLNGCLIVRLLSGHADVMEEQEQRLIIHVSLLLKLIHYSESDD